MFDWTFKISEVTAQVIYVLRAIIQIIFGIGTMPTYIKIQENKEVHLLMCKTRVQTIEAGNVERGHVPRSIFLVPEREQKRFGKNLV